MDGSSIYSGHMPRLVTPDPDVTSSTSTAGVRITRSGCIEEAAVLLAGCFRRLDEAQAKRTTPGARTEGRSGAVEALLAGDLKTTKSRKGTTTRKVPA